MLNLVYFQIVNICSTYLNDPSVSVGVRSELQAGPLDCALHTLIHTFAFWNETQYLGLGLENAEFLVPLFSSQHLGLRPLVGKV